MTAFPSLTKSQVLVCESPSLPGTISQRPTFLIGWCVAPCPSPDPRQDSRKGGTGNDTLIEIDLNGDAVADNQIQLNNLSSGINAPDLIL